MRELEDTVKVREVKGDKKRRIDSIERNSIAFEAHLLRFPLYDTAWLLERSSFPLATDQICERLELRNEYLFFEFLRLLPSRFTQISLSSDLACHSSLSADCVAKPKKLGNLPQNSGLISFPISHSPIHLKRAQLTNKMSEQPTSASTTSAPIPATIPSEASSSTASPVPPPTKPTAVEEDDSDDDSDSGDDEEDGPGLSFLIAVRKTLFLSLET